MSKTISAVNIAAMQKATGSIINAGARNSPQLYSSLPETNTAM